MFMKAVLKTSVSLAALLGSSCAALAGSSGPYIGISGGYGFGNSNQTDHGIPGATGGTTFDGHYAVGGGLVGGTLGYDLSSGPWLLGVEGDFSWADVSGHSNVCGPNTVTPHPCGTRLDDLGTVRGRVGYTPNSANWLIYATAGYAGGEIHGWDSTTPASGNAFRSGWTAGGGIEYDFNPNWSAKLEYLYVNLGNGVLFNVVPGVPESVSFNTNIIRVGLTYKFGAADPYKSPPLLTKR
jgi:outer membrane immunogenic protein